MLQYSRAEKVSNSMVSRSKVNNSKLKSSVVEGIEVENYLDYYLSALGAL